MTGKKNLKHLKELVEYQMNWTIERKKKSNELEERTKKEW